ncbi:MAG: PmoA family protein [Cyclobacteriaceae bacterium]|nr:PmoA family protein [Cyclobacteriaceae bacterium]
MLAAWALVPVAALLLSCSGEKKEESKEEENTSAVRLVRKDAENKIDVMVGDQLFTSYIYPENIMKPVLYPVVSSAGNRITRGYPIDKTPGERVDHPHHVGIWMNFGDVNGLDFWNNSTAIDPAKAEHYGTIRHREVVDMKESGNSASLTVMADWKRPDGSVLLEEKTSFTFKVEDNYRIIDRVATLTATDEDVLFKDNKEGMIAIRVTRALEHPSDKPSTFTDAAGNPTEVKSLDNEGVKGRYYSSEGLEGDDVWGTRARWVNLASELNGEEISVILIDHPQNPGYPTYWHARGYGLFAANTLGQAALSNGKDELNLQLKKGESATFRYRFVIYTGSRPDAAKIETFTKGF